MKKDFLFIVLIVGVIFASVSVYGWPDSYENQLINSQGYYKTDEVNATWQPITISPIYSYQPTYRGGNWIGDYSVSYSLPLNAAIFGAYGCCNENSNSTWYTNYSCAGVSARYREQAFDEWSCGWNIAFEEPGNQTTNESVGSVVDITGYTDPDWGVIDFQAITDGNIDYVNFQINFNLGAWIDIGNDYSSPYIVSWLDNESQSNVRIQTTPYYNSQQGQGVTEGPFQYFGLNWTNQTGNNSG